MRILGIAAAVVLVWLAACLLLMWDAR
ncbi:MAG: hypothetical protein JWM05_3499, partial [Acidimicrobiales bacterium]|nr:hypothetical protein [Acidimicrobiales bacterium]